MIKTSCSGPAFWYASMSVCKVTSDLNISPPVMSGKCSGVRPATTLNVFLIVSTNASVMNATVLVFRIISPCTAIINAVNWDVSKIMRRFEPVTLRSDRDEKVISMLFSTSLGTSLNNLESEGNSLFSWPTIIMNVLKLMVVESSSIRIPNGILPVIAYLIPVAFCPLGWVNSTEMVKTPA